MEVTIDALGRILIPKRIREKLGLDPNRKLRLEIDEEGIHLQPTGIEGFAEPESEPSGLTTFLGVRIEGDPNALVQESRRQRSAGLLREEAP